MHSTMGPSVVEAQDDGDIRRPTPTSASMRRPLVAVVMRSRFRDENRDYCNYGQCEDFDFDCFNQSATCASEGRQQPQPPSKEQQQRPAADGGGGLLSGVIFWRAKRNKKRSVSQSAAAFSAKCLSKAAAAGGGGSVGYGCVDCDHKQQVNRNHKHKHHNHQRKHDGLSPTTSGGTSSGGSSSSDDETHPVKSRLDFSFEQLMKTVKNKSDETALCPDDECLTCVTRRACIQSYPCGHKVLCEKCFVTLLQVNYSEGKYPVTCVFCRSPVALFKRQESPCSVVIKKGSDPPGSRGQSHFSLSSHLPSPMPSSSIKRPGYF